MASTRTESKPKPSPSENGFVELKPPPDSGFSGTAWFHAIDQKGMIEELLKRGYTRVIQ